MVALTKVDTFTVEEWERCMSEVSLSLSFEGLVTNDLTGEQASARLRFRVTDDTTIDLDVWGKQLHTTHHFESPGKPLGIFVIQDRLFGGVPGGHRERLETVINDPININRTRRNALHDLLARRTAAAMGDLAAD